jgi:serine/threonine protein kinase
VVRAGAPPSWREEGGPKDVYCPPEVYVRAAPASLPGVDAWTCGVLLLELLLAASGSSERATAVVPEAHPSVPPPFALVGFPTPIDSGSDMDTPQFREFEQLCRKHRVVAVAGDGTPQRVHRVPSGRSSASTSLPKAAHTSVCKERLIARCPSVRWPSQAGWEQALDLVSRLLSPLPSHRLSLEQAMKHPFFHEVRRKSRVMSSTRSK